LIEKIPVRHRPKKDEGNKRFTVKEAIIVIDKINEIIEQINKSQTGGKNERTKN